MRLVYGADARLFSGRPGPVGANFSALASMGLTLFCFERPVTSLGLNAVLIAEGISICSGTSRGVEPQYIALRVR